MRQGRSSRAHWGRVYLGLGAASAALSAWHGYRRNGTAQSAFLWGIAGAALPVVTPLVALGQGFAVPVAAEPAKRPQPVLPTQDERLPRVAEWAWKKFEKSIVERGFPSAVAGVAQGDGLQWFRGLGLTSVPDGTAVSSETVYRIGSLTKPMTAVLLLMLQEDGRLHLDQPLADVLPEASGIVGMDGQSARITLGQVASHTSGLPRVGRLRYDDGHEVTRQELLDGLAGLRLESAPGSKTSYSNLGYALLGQVIAKVAGVPYEQALQQRLLGPLGMTSTTFDGAAVAKRLAQPNVRTKSGFAAPKAIWRLGALNAMGGLYSTVEDLARFTAWHLSAANGSPSLLSAASFRLAHDAVMLTTGRPGKFAIGLASSVDPRIGKVLGHTGGTEGYSSLLALFPNENVAAMVFTNDNDAEQFDAMADRFARSVAVELAPKVQNV